LEEAVSDACIDGDNRLRSALTNSLFVLGHNEVLKAEFVALWIADRCEKLTHKLMKMLFANRIKIVLAVASGFDDPGNPQQGQVMADGWLALAQFVAQGADVQFAFAINSDANAGQIYQLGAYSAIVTSTRSPVS